MAVSHLCWFLESPGHWKICAALRGTPTTSFMQCRISLASVKDMEASGYAGLFFSLQAKPLLGYTGTNASAISRPASVADQSRIKVWITDTRHC